MSLFKKYPIFSAVVAVCLLAFLGGAFMAFKAAGNAEKAQRSLKNADTKLNSFLNSSPAPTKANLKLAKSNFNELQSALAGIREELQRGAALRTSTDGVSVIAGIQEFIFKFQKATASNRSEDDEPMPILTPRDFAFGFKKYLKAATPPDDPNVASVLDKQRQILSYLMSELISAKPHSIEAVEREILEGADKKSFKIDQAISARVPGAIDTMAFSLTFTGYTDTLRDFLNSLSGFELPIVVRSIAVKRPSGSETVVTNNNDGGNEDIFAQFGAGDDSTGETQPERPKPVVEENISLFTVILEFIEVVLPDSKKQEVQEDSDPA